jgi:hypothetical protein
MQLFGLKPAIKPYYHVCSMKNLVLVFEDDEFALLKRAKGKMTWRQFILGRVDRESRRPNPDISRDSPMATQTAPASSSFGLLGPKEVQSVRTDDASGRPFESLFGRAAPERRVALKADESLGGAQSG